MSTSIEKLIFGGQALSRTDGKTAFLWNALPGEEVEFLTTHEKSKLIEGVATNIIKASPDRTTPRDTHFLACSPWQILNFEAENKWKVTIAEETYRRVGKLENIPALTIASDSREYGYRNKMEYSFVVNEEGQLSLAHFDRGTHRLVPIDHCSLASDVITNLAARIVEWLRAESVPARSLKSLIVRSNSAGQGIVALFVKDEMGFAAYPELDSELIGFHVYYSNPRSPASTPDQCLYTTGNIFITEKLLGKTFEYGITSFFQVNPPVFEMALQDIAAHVNPGKLIIDYFSGVGAIGLSLADKAENIILIESNSEAVGYIEQNSALNNLKNIESRGALAVREKNLMTRESTVIVDPPRAGLEGNFIDRLIEVSPERLVYLSCDVGTQARDLALLSQSYQPIFWKLYNFFPHTPHIEALCILEKTKK